MPWVCPQCGNSTPDDQSTCPLDGYSKVAAGVALVSDATGREVQVRIPTSMGAASLARLGDPEVKYVSGDQFKVERRPDQGGWAVVNSVLATNPLFLNGAPIPAEGVVLKQGDKLSIKDKFFRLTVRLL
jgi:hypothetical protein